MRTLRVALGSDDGVTVVDGHMGEARSFHIYDVAEDGTFTPVERRPNPTLGREESHADEKKLKGASQAFQDCGVVIARHKSPNFLRMSEKTRFQPVVIRQERIEEVLSAFAAMFDQAWDRVQRRAAGERFKEILEPPRD